MGSALTELANVVEPLFLGLEGQLDEGECGKENVRPSTPQPTAYAVGTCSVPFTPLHAIALDEYVALEKNLASKVEPLPPHLFCPSACMVLHTPPCAWLTIDGRARPSSAGICELSTVRMAAPPRLLKPHTRALCRTRTSTPKSNDSSECMHPSPSPRWVSPAGVLPF